MAGPEILDIALGTVRVRYIIKSAIAMRAYMCIYLYAYLYLATAATLTGQRGADLRTGSSTYGCLRGHLHSRVSSRRKELV